MVPTAPTPSADTAGRRFDSLQQEAFLNLWRTYDRLKGIEDETFAEVGLSAQQYNALRLLRSVAPGSMATLDLGRRLISRAPDMTRMLDRLERRSLLTRNRQADNRRVVAVRITQQGLELLEEIHDRVQQCHQRQLGHLDAASLHQLTRLLQAARRPHEAADDRSFIDD